MPELTVGLGERSYPIVIRPGILDQVGPLLAERPVAKRYGLVADDRVAALFADRVLASCRRAGLAVELLTFVAGEEQKHLGTVEVLARRLAALGLDRQDGLIALGGGVTGDITGFVAAIYMRGVAFVQVPTTLLAQVDSSVGGKTGVDIPEGKNLVGAFHQPRAVYIDPAVLATLPRAELLNGLAEVIKYGVIRDAEFFAHIEAQRQAILDLDPAALEVVVARSCAIKAEVVAADEREGDLRRILNFGHTIGHAVEAASGYRLAHGQAVAIGMAAAARLAVAMGVCPAADRDRLVALIEACGLPVAIPPGYDAATLRRFLLADKKAVAGRPVFVLPRAIGEVFMTGAVDDALLDAVLRGEDGVPSAPAAAPGRS